MMRRLLLPALLASALLGGFAPAQAEDTLSPLHFQSQSLLGGYDTAALQRGFLVYQTVCASCHSANSLHYRDLQALGFTAEQAGGIAASVKLADGRPATLDDRFKNPHMTGAAFSGAMPPDLSNIAAERPNGPRYIYHLLTGYAPAPPGTVLMPGHFYDSGFPGGQIAMPPPLKGHDVAYADGVTASAPQEAEDVSAFLAWAAAPNLDARREIGVRAVLFLIFLSILAIATKRRIWRDTV
jgi:ubiquinol-cytochrome c reductase cytochrome c1 subunit